MNIVPFPSAPIARSGVLLKDFGYAIRLPEFGETIHELMKRRGAKVPDLLLVNEKEKTLIAVECKSDFTFEMEERLSKQMEFYSSEDFKRIWKEMFPSLDNLEIWLVSYANLGTKLADFIRHQMKTENLANIVFWEVQFERGREEAQIKKVDGTHLDRKLDEQMEKVGIASSPPRTQLLIDPTLKYGERVFIIGRRILGFMATAYIEEKDRIITLQDFREKYPDTIMADGELKKCLKYLMTLVPKIGEYNSATGEITLAKRPSLDKIKTRLENIQEMTDDDIKIELATTSKEERGIIRLKHPKSQGTKLDNWLPKGSISQGSGSMSTLFIRRIRHLNKNDGFFSRFANIPDPCANFAENDVSESYNNMVN